MTVATTDAAGKPHAAIVPVGCADGTLYFGVTPRTALLGNLRRDPTIAFVIDDKIVGRGRAEPAGRPGDRKELADALSVTLRAAIEQDWQGYLYVLQPARIFATLDEPST